MNSPILLILWSEMRPRMSVSHGCGSTPFGLAVSFDPHVLNVDNFVFFAETYGYVPVAPHSPFSSAR